ncbi:hypothetical protein BOX15_Mlig000686g3, partial [Macrostomum lignano]
PIQVCHNSAASQTVHAMSGDISLDLSLRQILKDSATEISTKLADRMRPLADSTRLLDVYEALTAVVYLTSSPSTLRFVTRKARMDSFVIGNWDYLGKSQTKEDMVESGFFYLMEEDHVKCFFCDLGLKDWDQGDHPEQEHVKFSPLCFFLKSSRGMERLRAMSERPPNYPTSYTRQDHNQLMKILGDELTSPQIDLVCRLGFSNTKVLLCIARKFIRFRQKYTRQELVVEMQKEWDREMADNPADPPHFNDKHDLAAVLREFYRHLGGRPPDHFESNQQQQQQQQQQQGNQTGRGTGSRCRQCNTRDVEIVCLPCGHLSLCMQCSRTARTCPAINCGQNADNFVRAFVS